MNQYSAKYDADGELDWKNREILKREASQIYGNVSLALPVRARALLKFIEAHYWRAKQDLDYAPARIRRLIHGHELDIDVYTRNWLWANGGRMDQDVVKCIREEFSYEEEQSKFLQKGMSLYGPWPTAI